MLNQNENLSIVFQEMEQKDTSMCVIELVTKR